MKPDIKLNSYESLFGELPDEGESTDLFIKELHDFKGHPFRVTDDEDMLELIQSIKEKGILVPLTVRPIAEGGYEISAQLWKAAMRSFPVTGESMRRRSPGLKRFLRSFGNCPMKMQWTS